MKDYTIQELKEVHAKYSNNIKQWKLYMAVYKGLQAIIKGGYILKHEREPQTAYERRINDLYNFGYSKSVVKIFNFHLFNSPPQGRELTELESNDIWKLFFKDADLNGTSYDQTISNLALNASIQGHMGILVDKSTKKYETIQEQKAAGVYPYIAAYHPPAILDWEFKKDENHRPYLSMVKLLDDDGQYRIWTITEWAVFQIPEGSEKNLSAKAKVVASGPNILKEIPFFWYYNIQTDERAIGESDLSEIATIELSIIKNMSQIEEIINFAAFPMMLKPRLSAKPSAVAQVSQEDEVSVQAVIEFDPEFPESAPKWLQPAVAEAIESILDTVAKKIAEIYRASNVGGLASTEVQTQAKSGIALKTEFQLLNSTLVSKAINTEDSENKILRLWMKWEKVYDKLKDTVHMGRSKSFDVQEIAIDLANALTAKTIIFSNKFHGLLQKQLSRQMLPSMSEQEKKEIDQEIETNLNTTSSFEDPLNDVDDQDKDILENGMKE